MPSQEEMLKNVRAAFESEPRINLQRYPIHMTFQDGIPTLDGEVEHIVAKKLSLELAAAVPGMDGLVDRLRVTPTLPMRDGAIRDSVRDVLLQEPAFATFAIRKRDKGRVETVRPAAWEPSGVIEVAVDDGVVTLDGQVPSLCHKRLAGVLTLMEHEHSPEAIRARLATEPRHTYLRDWVYGGIDGAVTTFAVVSGVMGAELSLGIVLVLGVANLVADGFSMAASNFAGTRTERDELRYWEAVKHRHVDTVPEGEREEVRQIFRQKGLTGGDLERLVAAITADRARWVRTMLAEEYGLPRQVRSPWRAALSTFSAFVLCGLAPLLPFAVGLPQAFVLAIAFTAGVFFTIGAVRSRWSPALWWHTGLSTLGMGMTAAGLAYGVGAWLKTLL